MAAYPDIAKVIEVEQTYITEYVGLQSWVVMHPVEFERCYLVDMINRRCTCMDWMCQPDKDAARDCKHIIATERLHRAMFPEKYPARYIHKQPVVRDADADGDPFMRL